MSTHPSEVNEALAIAGIRCERLIGDAEKRGDAAGAAAWREARESIEAAEKKMQEAREKQTWREVQHEDVGERAARRCGCAIQGVRSIKCRVHTCCAVYRNTTGNDQMTHQCTLPIGHKGEHREQQR